ncbi:MAG TPA: hypothetical protein VFV50_09160 [Bdellovibrionales bacterium]|nr:hypothetical protein [Bdellovibrionales bacterium]
MIKSMFTAVFTAALFATTAQAAHSPCTDAARVEAVSHLVKKHGDEFTNSLFISDSFVLKSEGKEIIRTLFHTGAHDSVDVVNYYVDTVVVDTKRAASRIHRCVFFETTSGIVRDDPR